MVKLNFLKAHGLENDFVILFNQDKGILTKKLINFISDRKIGIGCDLVVLLNESKDNLSKFICSFFNKDGSEAEICGNAIRCVGEYYFNKTGESQLTIETVSGLIDIEKYDENSIAVDLGIPSLNWEKIPLIKNFNTKDLDFNFKYLKGGFSINIGNPHVVFFVDKLDEEKLRYDSKKIINEDVFPEGVNISAVEIINRDQIKIITYERGVGMTEACGSGAGASVYASNKMKLCNNRVNVIMRGGKLGVEITKDDHILIVGDAKEVFMGTINIEGYI